MLDGCWIGDDFKLLLVAVETQDEMGGKNGRTKKGVYDNVSKKKGKEERVN